MPGGHARQGHHALSSAWSSAARDGSAFPKYSAAYEFSGVWCRFFFFLVMGVYSLAVKIRPRFKFFEHIY